MRRFKQPALRELGVQIPQIGGVAWYFPGGRQLLQRDLHLLRRPGLRYDREAVTMR